MTTWSVIDSKDAPASNVFDFASLTLTGYSAIQIVCSAITVATDGTDIKLTFYVSGSEVTSGYRWSNQSTTSNTGSGLDDGSTSAAAILLVSDNSTWDVGSDTGEGFGCVITVDNPLSTALYKKAGFHCAFTGTTGAVFGNSGVGIMENAGAITGLKISGTSNLTAGKVRVLGIA